MDKNEKITKIIAESQWMIRKHEEIKQKLGDNENNAYRIVLSNIFADMVKVGMKTSNPASLDYEFNIMKEIDIDKLNEIEEEHSKIIKDLLNLKKEVTSN
jgi:nickel-dependent lactate racemase